MNEYDDHSDHGSGRQDFPSGAQWVGLRSVQGRLGNQTHARIRICVMRFARTLIKPAASRAILTATVSGTMLARTQLRRHSLARLFRESGENIEPWLCSHEPAMYYCSLRRYKPVLFIG